MLKPLIDTIAQRFGSGFPGRKSRICGERCCHVIAVLFQYRFVFSVQLTPDGIGFREGLWLIEIEVCQVFKAGVNEALSTRISFENSAGRLSHLPAHACHNPPRNHCHSQGCTTTASSRGFASYPRPLRTFD
jgi:hypothetical protein